MDDFENSVSCRQRLYRARKRRQAYGDHSFDNLTFRLEGTRLTIKERGVSAADPIYAENHSLTEMRRLVGLDETEFFESDE